LTGSVAPPEPAAQAAPVAQARIPLPRPNPPPVR
jgi:hypothetical protein